MAPNKSESLLQMVYDDVEKWLRQFEFYFEDNSVAHIGLKAFFFLAGIFGAFADVIGFTQGFWSPQTSKYFLLIMIFVMLAVDYKHVLIAKSRAVEINRQKRLVNNMTKIIRDASGLNTPAYNITDWYIEHDITIDGDVFYKRYMKISYINDTVYWVRIPIGVIDGDTEDKIDDLKISITNPADGGVLPYAIIDQSDKKKDLAVMMEPPVRPNRDSELRLRLVWRGAYRPLIKTFIDRGKLTVHHFATKIKIKFIAPRGYVFTGIRMVDDLGTFAITEQEGERSVLTWDCENLTNGDYSYSLVCARKEP